MSSAMRRSVVVTDVERVGEEFGFAGLTYRVRLQGTDAPAAVIAKLWELRDREDVRELHFYRELAADTPIPLPDYHHGDVDHQQGRAWLVLEALDGFRQGDDLVDEPLATVVRLVEAVARIQCAWWGRLADRGWMSQAPRSRRDPAYLETRRTDYLDRFGSLDDPVAAQLFDAIPAVVPLATELLEGAPETLVHQDLGQDNVLFLLPGEVPVPIDWAHCGRGPGVLDLATILFGTAPLDAFGDVVDCYVAAVRHSRVADVTAAEIRTWLNGAMIHAFVTYTLGVARWAAPTARGLQILDRVVARTSPVVVAWRKLDPAFFERLAL